MATGVKAARRIQLGRETTPGTGVVATARMRWNGGMLDDQREVKFPEELVGIYGGTDRSLIAKVAGALDIAETPLTPEQLPYLLAMLYGGPVTGTADGAGSTGFRYACTIPTLPSSPPTNTSYTVEAGDNNEVERMDYAKCLKLTIKGAGESECTMSASLIGQEVARYSTGFANVSLVETNDLIFAGSRLYLDAIGGTIGTTAIASQFLGFEVTFEAMWIPKYTGEGATGAPVWSFVVFTDKKITGKITLEHDTAADGNTGLKSIFRAQTPRLMRIDILGQAFATPGSGSQTFTGGRRGVRIDLPIKITKAPPFDDMSGNSVINFEFESKYNATAATAGTITAVNEVSALP